MSREAWLKLVSNKNKQPHTLPSVADYREYISRAVWLEHRTIDDIRHSFGNCTYLGWYKYFDAKKRGLI